RADVAHGDREKSVETHRIADFRDQAELGGQADDVAMNPVRRNLFTQHAYRRARLERLAQLRAHAAAAELDDVGVATMVFDGCHDSKKLGRPLRGLVRSIAAQSREIARSAR